MLPGRASRGRALRHACASFQRVQRAHKVARDAADALEAQRPCRILPRYLSELPSRVPSRTSPPSRIDFAQLMLIYQYELNYKYKLRARLLPCLSFAAAERGKGARDTACAAPRCARAKRPRPRGGRSAGQTSPITPTYPHTGSRSTGWLIAAVAHASSRACSAR